MRVNKRDKLGKKHILPYILALELIAVFGILMFIVYRDMTDDYEPQQNVYFLEYENDKEGDTVIFKYDYIKDEVTEIGRIRGYFRHCVINEEETTITGIFSEKIVNSECDLVRFDIATGAVEPQNVTEKISELAKGNEKWFNALVYDEGNKILISYDDENGSKRWLFYDPITEEYEDMIQEESAAVEFLTIHNNNLWYRTGTGSLYQYDLDTQVKTVITDSVHNSSAAIAPDIGLMAYTKDISRKKIYLYDINDQRTKCIAGGGWNICYGDLSFTDAGWSNDGRQFFYIKSFPGLFDEATKRLVIYDVKTGRSHCIYKKDMTLHEFRYVERR